MRTTYTVASLTLLGLLTGCLSSPLNSEGDLSEISAEVRDTPRYQQAKQFDGFLQQTLSSEERKSAIEACRSSQTSNPFCFSISREKSLRAHLAEEEKKAQPPLKEKPEAIVPKLVGNKIESWNQIQKANLKALLAGMRTFSLQELKTAGNYALKRPECPNSIAVATAALLEVHLPVENLANQIAVLYEKGARCTRKRTPNHEHYLTRAALFYFMQKKYAAAEKLLARVHPMDAYSGRSLYWLFRARQAQGKTAAAKTAKDRLKKEFPLSFHAIMANAIDRTDPLQVGAGTALPTKSKNSRTSSLITQAETLHELGFRTSAAKLVGWALAKFSPEDPGLRAYLASLGSPSTQVRTLQTLLLTKPSLRNQTYFQLAYPKPFFEIFNQYASQVDPYLLLAVARKESTLDPKAVSPANAQGLLQLNPDTAKRLSGSDSLDLFDPKVNTELAARYWEQLRLEMKGQLPLMIASYNAGEQTVANWTQRYPTNELLFFMDLIPYRETRDYVGFVLTNYFWYRRLYANQPEQILASHAQSEIARVEGGRESRQIESIDEASQPAP